MEDTAHGADTGPAHTMIMQSPPVPVPSAPLVLETTRAFEQLRRAVAESPSDLHRMGVLQESTVEARDAVRAVVAMSPEVLVALGDVMRLPEEQRQTIAAVLELPIAVQATLRAILS